MSRLPIIRHLRWAWYFLAYANSIGFTRPEFEYHLDDIWEGRA